MTSALPSLLAKAGWAGNPPKSHGTAPLGVQQVPPLGPTLNSLMTSGDTCADRVAGGNAAADEDDAIEASDDEGFGGVPAMQPAAAFKRSAPITPRQQSVSAAWTESHSGMQILFGYVRPAWKTVSPLTDSRYED
jgi:hypothetical protein